MKNTIGISAVAGLLVSWIITIITTLLLAVICYKFCITRDKAKLLVLGIYFISNFLGGFVCGKKGKSRKFLKGAFCGLLYCVILIIVSVIVGGGMSKNMGDLLLTFALCVISGMFGGMIS